MSIPLSLREYGVTEEDFNANIDTIAKNAVGDACTGSNPREISPEQMKEVFVCAFEGKKVGF